MTNWLRTYYKQANKQTSKHFFELGHELNFVSFGLNQPFDKFIEFFPNFFKS